jgi:hypothetical protein
MRAMDIRGLIERDPAGQYILTPWGALGVSHPAQKGALR